jgi:Right handed beta helix region
MGRRHIRRIDAIAFAIGLGACVACAPVRATAERAEQQAEARPLAPALLRALDGEYTGFGAGARGGADAPVFVVRSLADAGPGTLREALAAAHGAGSGLILFEVAGDIVLASDLEVPAHSTLDGLSAPDPGITLWGDHVGGSRGVVDILDSDVVVRGLRIRNASNDGIHVAPQHGYAIRDIVVDHCSITNSADGGIDVTGRDGLLVTDVTLSWNYVAGSGSVCAKGTCGGGALIKYGVDRISVHGNLWDKNLRRNPTVDGAAVAGGTLADIRGNVVRRYEQSGIQVVAGARANVVGNTFDRSGAVYFPDGRVYMAYNVNGTAGNQPAPYDVATPLSDVAEGDVLAGAGALPRDAVDEFYLHDLDTWGEVKETVMGPGARAPDPSPTATPAAMPTPATSATPVWTPLGVPAPSPAVEGYAFPPLPPNPIDAATLTAAGERRRLADRARRGRADARALAVVAYADVVRLLQGASGPLAPVAHVTMARAEDALAQLSRRRPTVDLVAALQHARASVEHCRLGSCSGARSRRARRTVRYVTRALVRRGQAPPPWDPPSY